MNKNEKKKFFDRLRMTKSVKLNKTYVSIVVKKVKKRHFDTIFFFYETKITQCDSK